MSLPVKKIVSGGQTGVDRAALDAAMQAGIECGGWCPKNRMAEDGVISPNYPLRETAACCYQERTMLNVRDSDGTLILAPLPLSGGTALTRQFAENMGKPLLVLDPVGGGYSKAAEWMRKNRIAVLNVAGPRESNVPGIYEQVRKFLRECFAVPPASEALTEWNLGKLLPLLRDCGKIGMRYSAAPPSQLKNDLSVVTLADRKIEQLLDEKFNHPELGVYMIGEETVESRSRHYLEKALAGDCWVVDPIDGTAPYSVQIPLWGISVAFMRAGKILEGAIYFPAIGEIIITSGTDVLHATGFTPGGKTSPVLRRIKFHKHRLNPGGIISISQSAARRAIFELPNQVIALSCCVVSLAWLSLGRFMAYVAMFKLWDVAAALAILERGGFKGRLLDGSEITDAIDNGCFNLELDSPHCWKLREHAIFAPNDKIINFIRKRIHFKD